ncbi:hypothetical protein BX666DRAFT_1860419 [Dichotomocladium elegans]|nr:hypothetical protein BX666DRAFT_1860419 [Dichotomocladium elegans]
MNNDPWALQEPVPFEDFEFTLSLPDFSIPLPSSDDFWATGSSSSSCSVLNETDQREFSNFLDTFFVDDEVEEERRRYSILQSLDEQKRQSPSPTSTAPLRRRKSGRELLTEEEKRMNHIASEQKRRCTIRNGFKNLTELVPSLKNMSNSKSNVLFQAVDYIKYLEKRNKSLQQKIQSLEYRASLRLSDDQSQRLIKLQEQLQYHQRRLSQQQALKECTYVHPNDIVDSEAAIQPTISA